MPIEPLSEDISSAEASSLSGRRKHDSTIGLRIDPRDVHLLSVQLLD